ncbi:1517_t:CDS:2, partial [Acaulospora colombiana]
IAASQLLVKSEEVTRSTVQKAVVILASKPVFGPIRDKLGVVTQALFNQRDFREMDILVDFFATLESSLRTQLTESGFYMGTSMHRTLNLVKALMLQRRLNDYARINTLSFLIPGLVDISYEAIDPLAISC